MEVTRRRTKPAFIFTSNQCQTKPEKNIDMIMLEDRTKRTFKFRREEVCGEKLTVQNLIDKYPALQFPFCVSNVFFKQF